MRKPREMPSETVVLLGVCCPGFSGDIHAGAALSRFVF